VKCDSQAAAEWFRQSAEQGYTTAQNNLGYLFEHGQGVPVDYSEAEKWYRLAAEKGDFRAKNAMETLAQVMTQKQLRESESRASAWQENMTKTIQASALNGSR
jgi:TPR repeat protein